MKALVIIFFGAANATLFQAIFSDRRDRKTNDNYNDRDGSDEDNSMPVYHNKRVGSLATSPESFWRLPPPSTVRPFMRPPPQKSFEEEARTEGPRTTEPYAWYDGRSAPAQDVFEDRHSSTLHPPWKNKVSYGVDEKDTFEVEGSVGMRSAEKWCSHYMKKCKSKRELGNGLATRIIGGRPAQPMQHPHMVMIGYGPESGKQWLCGGTLISGRYILSAAHCTHTAKLGPASWARLGELDVSTSEDNASPQEKEIVERLRHPGYREPATYNDIALFKLDSDVVFSSWVYPACLQLRRNIGAPTATATGWGRTGFVSEISRKLLEVNVNIFGDNYCNFTINKGAGPKMPRGFDATTMICAGERAGGKDACQGDSGGPLVIAGDGCVKTQIGITSIGSECGLPESPGVYTRVSEYVPWIEGIVWS